MSKEEINSYLHDKYDRLPLFERVEEIAKKLCSFHYKGKISQVKTFEKLLYEHSNFQNDYKTIMTEFFLSEYSRIHLDEKAVKSFMSKEELAYEDALILAYIKGTLEGFLYEANIQQVVIDEAQDYNRLQYIIIRHIFQKADFTLLGDIHQNINPYYQYHSLEDLKNLFSGDTSYLELLKTYRSSPEIIDYTNKILNLHHVNAIRHETNKPVRIRKGVEDLTRSLLEDIETLQKQYKSVAVITKDLKEAMHLYELLKDSISISLVDLHTKGFHKECIIIPAYLSKGLEFDSVIVYNNRDNSYRKNERNLLYVACTRCQQELYIYN